MKYYELDRGGEETKYCEPELFGEWEEEVLWKTEEHNDHIQSSFLCLCDRGRGFPPFLFFRRLPADLKAERGEADTRP